MDFYKMKKDVTLYIQETFLNMKIGEKIEYKQLQYKLNLKFGLGKKTVLESINYWVMQGIIKYDEEKGIITKVS